MTSSSFGSSIPLRLTASDRSSFAYTTVKERMPVILCRIVDTLYRQRSKFSSKKESDELKDLLERLAKMRYEMQTDKPLVEVTDGRRDRSVWNDYINQEEVTTGKKATWFTTSWLLAECYMYRRIMEGVEQSMPSRTLDVFTTQKEEAFVTALPAMVAMANFSITNEVADIRSRLNLLIKMCLWANKCDLSISHGVNENHFDDFEHPETLVTENQCFLLRDDSRELIELLMSKHEGNGSIDFVLDNVGFELFCDLVLINFLIDYNIVDKVRLHPKNFGWFVSDATYEDITWTLKEMENHQSVNLSKLAVNIKSKIEMNKIVFSDTHFWTYPHAFWEMSQADPTLYSLLSESKLVVFKGDLNYRKLVGDRAWRTTDDFPLALMGFRPTSVVTLRTLKADVVVGLRDADAAVVLDNIDPKWMIDGQWGVIHLCKNDQHSQP